MSSQRFTHFWAAETIRQQEVDAGPLADDAANRRAQTAADAEAFVLQRAHHLAEAQQLIPLLHSYQQRISAGLWLVFMLACLSGAGLALNLAPQSARQISLIEAVSVVILANLLFILLWLFTMVRRQAPGGLGYWLQHYLHKLTRNQQRLAVAQSYTQLCAQQGLLKPALSSISHAIWATILGVAVLVLTLRFIAYDYQFVWQTTLLSAQQISSLIDALHLLPGILGIEPPLVDSATQISTNPRATAIWLLTVIVLYAWLPRIILLIACEWLRRRRLRQLRLDWTKPGYAELRAAFASGAAREIDPAPADIEVISKRSAPAPATKASACMLMTLELPDALVERLANLLREHHNLTWSANINSASDRRQWLNHLANFQSHNQSAPQLLLVINPLLSPDRGSLRFLEALTHHAHLHIILSLQDSVRGKLWSDALQEHLPEVKLLTSIGSNLQPKSATHSNVSTPALDSCFAEIKEIIDAWKV
ncbi:MAG: DUF2868 domain-containing protein [Idiomarina sp.]|nr:DUF2868 domain-containing protein [Idiomarina sp.]